MALNAHAAHDEPTAHNRLCHQAGGRLGMTIRIGKLVPEEQLHPSTIAGQYSWALSAPARRYTRPATDSSLGLRASTRLPPCESSTGISGAGSAFGREVMAALHPLLSFGRSAVRRIASGMAASHRTSQTRLRVQIVRSGFTTSIHSAATTGEQDIHGGAFVDMVRYGAARPLSFEPKALEYWAHHRCEAAV